MRSIADLLAAARITGGRPAHEDERRRIALLLERERGFPQGFWHADDEDGASDVMLGCLGDLGVPAAALPADLLRSVVTRFAAGDSEDEARRHQIGAALRHVNAYFTTQASPLRFYSFAEDLPGWESDEPVWILLTAEDRARLLALDVIRPPVGLEKEYDPD